MNRVNPAAVVVSGIVFWIVQAGWYTMFSQTYVNALGMAPEQVKAAMAHPSALPYITALLANMLIAYVISIVMVRTGAATVARGMIVALVLWGGILMTTLATDYSFEQRPFALLAINGGCALVGMLAMGALVGAWKKPAKQAMTSAAGA